MATYYVSSVDGNDADDGSTWALAKATITGALLLATASGDIVFVDSAHDFAAGAAANVSYNTPTSGHVAVLSVNRNGSNTTGHSGWLAGAKETSGSSAGFFIANSSSVIVKLFIYGVSINVHSTASVSCDINVATGTAASITHTVVFETCTFSQNNTSTGSTFTIGATGGSTTYPNFVRFRNCTINLQNHTNAGGGIQIAFSVEVDFIGCTFGFSGGSKPPQLFRGNSTRSAILRVMDSDLSGYDASGGAYLALSSFEGGQVMFLNCKLSATPTLTSGSFPAYGAASVTFVNCDSADTNIAFSYRTRLGTLTQSTSIYAGSGATHDATAVSWAITTTADCNEFHPFITPWIEKWGASTAAQTQTIEYVRDSANTMNNRQIWAEFERVSDASFPKGTLLSVRNATPFDGAGVNWGTGAATWTGTGGSAVTGKLTSGSITPAEKSLLRARVSVGVASITDLYLDPKLRIA